ncbi:MAG: hypothetical protein KGL39_15485 [Patescibacteria group bacterium]|nr:hypothetical protein [Patescibacteria group bacterium]
MNAPDAWDAIGMQWTVCMLVLIVLLFAAITLCRKRRPKGRPRIFVPPPRNCRVIRADNYAVGKARYRFF